MAENEFIEAVRRRAYQIWDGAGRPDGYDVDHWLQAEAEYRSQSVQPNGPQPQGETKPPARSPAKPNPKASQKPNRATAKT